MRSPSRRRVLRGPTHRFGRYRSSRCPRHGGIRQQRPQRARLLTDLRKPSKRSANTRCRGRRLSDWLRTWPRWAWAMPPRHSWARRGCVAAAPALSEPTRPGRARLPVTAPLLRMPVPRHLWTKRGRVLKRLGCIVFHADDNLPRQAGVDDVVSRSRLASKTLAGNRATVLGCWSALRKFVKDARSDVAKLDVYPLRPLNEQGERLVGGAAVTGAEHSFGLVDVPADTRACSS